MFRWQKDHIRNAEHTDFEVNEALGKILSARDIALTDFFEYGNVDYIALIELYVAHGLPSNDGSESDDAMRDQYAAAFETIISALREHFADDISSLIAREREAKIEEVELDEADDKLWDQVEWAA